MDYSVFKPGDKVRSIRPVFSNPVTGVVLFSNEKCVLLQPDEGEKPELYSSFDFEKVPERTSSWYNVYLDNAKHPKVAIFWYGLKETALKYRGVHNYIGMFEQVFEDGKLVETKYHPDD